MPEPVNRDEVEHVACGIADSAWSRRALLLGAGIGAAGLALSDATQALARVASRGRAGAQEVVNVASTIEELTTLVTTTALQKQSLPTAAVETVGAASREELDHLAGETWTSDGRSTGYPTPVLGVISGSDDRWLGNSPTAPSAHSVAVDPVNSHVFALIPGHGIAVFTGP
jgi:hypothetical protein